MNTLIWRSAIGAIAGAVSSAALVATGEHVFLKLPTLVWAWPGDGCSA